MALSLISIGSGAVFGLQSFIVMTAVPGSQALLALLWDAFRIVCERHTEQPQ